MMLLASLFDGPTILVFLGMALVTTLLVRSSAKRSMKSRSRDVLGEAREELTLRDQAASNLIQKMEVRLHDYGREIEGRMEARLDLLDQLIIDADREIIRLQTALAETYRKSSSTSGSHEQCDLSAEQHQMLHHLADAGYSAGEIANLIQASVAEISAMLNSRDNNSNAAA